MRRVGRKLTYHTGKCVQTPHLPNQKAAIMQGPPKEQENPSSHVAGSDPGGRYARVSAG